MNKSSWIYSMVMVDAAIDTEIHDVTRYIGRVGEIVDEFDEGTFCGAFLVGFCDGTEEMFWPEELALL